MRFSTEQDLSVNKDRLAVAVSDRFLPSHPKERYGNLPHWYFRTRFKGYGTARYDLPFRSLRRYPEYNERIWHRVCVKTRMEKFFWLGALLPFHSLFFEAHWPLEVEGEKRDPNAPWGFEYF